MRMRSYTFPAAIKNLNNYIKHESYEKILVIRGLSPHGINNFTLIGLFFILWVILNYLDSMIQYFS